MAVPQVSQVKSVSIDSVLVHPWTASIKDSSTETWSQIWKMSATFWMEGEAHELHNVSSNVKYNLNIFTTHVPVEDVENLVSR